MCGDRSTGRRAVGGPLPAPEKICAGRPALIPIRVRKANRSGALPPRAFPPEQERGEHYMAKKKAKKKAKAKK
jgi:hypothetical protein